MHYGSYPTRKLTRWTLNPYIQIFSPFNPHAITSRVFVTGGSMICRKTSSAPCWTCWCFPRRSSALPARSRGSLSPKGVVTSQQENNMPDLERIIRQMELETATPNHRPLISAKHHRQDRIRFNILYIFIAIAVLVVIIKVVDNIWN